MGFGIQSIGTPIKNALCYVIASTTDTNALVPPGVAGELWIGGVGVARGYHDRPELTAAKFVPDPFGGAEGRVYKTGDLVRWNPEGELEFIGRVDHQVKVRGFRVELGEVEAALQRLEGVRGAACVVRDGALVGYVAPAGLDAERLKASLASSLPAYMVPSVVVALAVLPLTPNGKVDRKALPDPEFKQAEYEAPRTPNETALCAVFENVLGVARVGVHDDFFALGGHSLLAVKLVNNLRKSLCPRVSVRDLLECTTPAQIAVRVQAMETGATAAVEEGEDMSTRIGRTNHVAPVQGAHAAARHQLELGWGAVSRGCSSPTQEDVEELEAMRGPEHANNVSFIACCGSRVGSSTCSSDVDECVVL